jgi:hypothetical protein
MAVTLIRQVLVFATLGSGLFLSSGAYAVASPVERADSLRAIALRVADLEMRRQLVTATSATVDSLLALYADSVVYEHPNAGAVVRGKELMHSSMLQFIGSVRALQIESPHVIVGHGVVIVESHARMELNDEGRWIPVERHGLRVIEFDTAGLVRRIIDYPW